LRPFVRTTAIATLMTLAVCPLAHAQRPRPDRAYRGLFGGNGANPNSSQVFDMNISLFGAYDDNVLATANQGYVGDPRFQQNGSYGSGTISLDYTKKAGRATFDFTGGYAYRYYPLYEELNGFNSWLSAGLSAKLSPRTDLRLTESVSYSPFYSFSASPGLRPSVPGDVLPISPDNPLAEQPAVNTYSAVSVSRRLTPRSSASADYGLSYAHYSDQDLPYQNWSVGGGYSYRLSGRTNVRAAYHYRHGVSGLYYSNQAIDTHDIVAGLDYSKKLSPTRTVSLGFTIGPSIYRGYAPIGDGTDVVYQEVTRYPIIASAYLNGQIARSWSLGVNYSRGMQYTQGFSDPFFSNAVVGSLSGFVAERGQLTFSAGYDTGSVGVTATGRGYNTATAGINFQFAVNRWAALFARYGFYHYLFDQSVTLPAALTQGQDRQSISGGVNLWLPLLR
jgi:hypothetical protein